jgi:hypothetical protein
MLNISFSACQSAGKSTLLQECKKYYSSDKFEFVDEITRKVARQYSFAAINEKTNNTTQLLILNEVLINHILPRDKHVIMDRCILDSVIYTSYFVTLGVVDKWVFDYSVKLFDMLWPKLDIVFYPNPYEVPIVDDGERSTDVDFRNAIIHSFEGWIKLPRIAKKIVTLEGSVEERMQKIKYHLAEYE